MRRLLPLALGFALLATPVAAHPHIFIDAKATIVLDDSGAVTEVRNEWSFDEAFSAWSVEGLDTNNDGVVSREEQQELANQDMDGLAQYQFYTFAGEQGAADNLLFERGANPTRDFVDGHTILRFGVKLAEPYRIKRGLELAINDPEFYVAITFAGPEAITLENAPEGCSVGLQPGFDLTPELQEQLGSLPADVTELPPDLERAIRGSQGAILVTCPPSADAPPPPVAETAVDAATQVAEAKPAMPFGGPPPEPGLAMPRTGFLGWVNEQQRNFYRATNDALSALKTDWTAFWVLGGLSFLYGVFHAAGPGHGKVVISSYVLASERQLKQGILLSFASAMVQSLVAIGFVLIAVLALNATSIAMADAANWIGIASYGLVALLGLWLIARKLFGWGHSHHHHEPIDLTQKAHASLHAGQGGHALNRGQLDIAAKFQKGPDAFGRPPGDPHYGHTHGPNDHDHGHHHVVTADQVKGDWREQLGVVIGVGLRPCSGALVVLVFAYSQGLLAAGIVAVFLMGLGTAITVAVLASLAVGAKGLARKLLGRREGLAAGVIWWAELLGAMLVFAFGMILLLASL